MSTPEHNHVLREIVSQFEALAMQIEHAIEALAQDDSGTIDLGALQRAKDAAQRGANITHNAMWGIRSAFD